jgi:tripartite-type tricarboxylate transporter receptor subunit TctC
MEMLKRSTGIDVQAVDYRGLPPGIVDLVAGRLDLAFLSTGLAMPHIREGRMHAIGTIGPVRAPELPDLPTLAEQGIADANVDSWYAAIAPRGVPAPVVERIGAAFTTALGMPSVQAKLAAAGTVPARPVPPDAVQAMLRREYAGYATLVREANIRAE